jgi:alpha-ketoglutarate-dependent taurine dioxygenase
MQTESTATARPPSAATPPFSLRRVGVFLGAEITGIDLTRPLERATVEALQQAHAEHGVLVFPDQKIAAEDLRRFGRCFGDLSVHPFSAAAPSSWAPASPPRSPRRPPLRRQVGRTGRSGCWCPTRPAVSPTSWAA